MRYLITALVLLISIPATAQDFRGVEWGATKAEIIEQEGEPDIDQDGMVGYHDELVNMDVVALYHLAPGVDRFGRGAYLFRNQHSNENAFIEDYKKVADALQDKYGEPDTDRTAWKNDLYQDDPSRYGFAISIGHMVKQQIWNLDSGRVFHQLQGDNYNIVHMIQYQNEDGEALMEEAQRQVDDSKL